MNDKLVVEFFKAELIQHSVSLLRSLQPYRKGVVNLRLQFQKLARALAHLKPCRKALARIFKKGCRNILQCNALNCCGVQTVGLTVGIRLVEAVDTIGWKSSFNERLDDGLGSMYPLDRVQQQLKRIAEHLSSKLKIMRDAGKN